MSRSTARPVPFVPRTVAFALVPLVGVGLAGLPYYGLPLAERLRHPMHEWLRPSGLVGQSAGFLAFALFLFLWLYPIRKRFRQLRYNPLFIQRWHGQC